MTILTVRQAAEFLRVSPRHLRQLCKDSDIPYRRVGRGHITFSQEALEEWWAKDLKPLVQQIFLKKISIKDRR